MKFIYSFLLFLGVFLIGFDWCWSRNFKKRLLKYNSEVAFIESYNEALTKTSNHADSIGLNDLGNELRLVEATSYFNSAEKTLKTAREIGLPPDFPVIKKLINSADKDYKRARDLIDKVVKMDDVDLEFHRLYLRGEIYYRFLEFFSTPQTNQELFRKTLDSWKKALDIYPGDPETVANIELLIKNSNNMGQSGDPKSMGNRMLPQVGIGNKKGN
jgi:tetratricopeptide (TPR) repeat protein